MTPSPLCNTSSDREYSCSCLSLVPSTFCLQWKPLRRGAWLLFSIVWNVWGRKAQQYLNHDKMEGDQHLKIAATQRRTIIAPKSDRFCLQMGRTYRPVSICRCFSGGLIRAGSFTPFASHYQMYWCSLWCGDIPDEHWSGVPTLVS